MSRTPKTFTEPAVAERPLTTVRPVRWWEWAATLIALLPAFVWLPSVIEAAAKAHGQMRILTFFFPAYALCSALIAMLCFRRRPVLGWIIVALLAISDLCVLYLADLIAR